ncbi:PIR Superfamily Protein [Plasmodium ovale curtisi]|uniref:PIR Superfamily Protein n=1 Tax=Plasmodium ovale curtisi TaxID=864141 RepID=A0A1A8WDZ0_PLAOA|nr:PIR Superfamily Protein [Plasmodium ovale curtisi]
MLELSFSNLPYDEFNKQFKKYIKYEESLKINSTADTDFPTVKTWIDNYKTNVSDYFNNKSQLWDINIKEKRCRDLYYFIEDLENIVLIILSKAIYNWQKGDFI